MKASQEILFLSPNYQSYCLASNFSRTRGGEGIPMRQGGRKCRGGSRTVAVASILSCLAPRAAGSGAETAPKMKVSLFLKSLFRGLSSPSRLFIHKLGCLGRGNVPSIAAFFFQRIQWWRESKALLHQHPIQRWGREEFDRGIGERRRPKSIHNGKYANWGCSLDSSKFTDGR